MKRFLLAILFLIGSFGILNAQTTPKKTVHKKEVVSKSKPGGEKVVTSADTTKHLKKDGTADKRFKENKVKHQLKKDGTPDKRFKENKSKS